MKVGQCGLIQNHPLHAMAQRGVVHRQQPLGDAPLVEIPPLRHEGSVGFRTAPAEHGLQLLDVAPQIGLT